MSKKGDSKISKDYEKGYSDGRSGKSDSDRYKGVAGTILQVIEAVVPGIDPPSRSDTYRAGQKEGKSDRNKK